MVLMGYGRTYRQPHDDGASFILEAGVDMTTSSKPGSWSNCLRSACGLMF
jgi:hypothetical protein